MNFIFKFTNKDLYFSLATGLITGIFAWRIFEFLDISNIQITKNVCPLETMCYPTYLPVSWAWLTLIVPVLWILGVMLGYFLGKWFGFFNQFGKFAAIGFTNAAVDFAVLNVLIANTDISSGGRYVVFKAISFLCAIIPSYFWNKYWAFRPATEIAKGVEPQGQWGDQRSAQNNIGTGTFEFAKFMTIAVVSIFVNTGVASLVVNYVNPLGGLTTEVWANVGAVVGSAFALIFSFVGFRVAVFKR